VLVAGGDVPAGPLDTDLPAAAGPVSMTDFVARPIRPQGFSDRRGVTAAGWALPPGGMSPALLVAVEHLHRRYLHAELREHRGAYAVGTTYDPLTGELAVWSEADPDPARSLDFYPRLPDLLRTDPLAADDLLTAQLMAVQAERRRRGSLPYLLALADIIPEDRALDRRVARVDAESLRAVATELSAAHYHAEAFM
jgi:hypothetical protein